MCRIYAGLGDDDCRPVTRSVRLSGFVTSIRLEARVWAIIDRMAVREGMSTPRFLSKLHDEVLDLQGEVRNFASLLRVACLVFLEREAGTPPAAAAAGAEPLTLLGL
jgi:predicted DNA-binding ribbon-helix-helix protein